MESEKAVRHGLALLTASFRQEVDTIQVRAYLHGLKDLPAHVITEGASRLAREIGRRFFPTVPEWRTACAAIVDERRADAARRAKALQEDCPDCHGSGWANAEGPNAVIRCVCAKRALELLRDAGEPLERPERLALPTGDLP